MRGVMLGRIRRALRALGMTVAASALFVISSKDNSKSMLKTGDFPAFYSMAVIADSNEPAHLYDLELQTKIQNERWPWMSGSVLPGAYPPYVALLLRPLAWMSPVAGKLLWAFASIAALFLTTLQLCRINPRLAPIKVDLFAGLILFAPILVATVGAQNTCFGMLLYALSIESEAIRRRSMWIYGLAAGLWLFKPQYALLAILPALLKRQWKALATFSAVAVVAYLLGACVLGFSWPRDWLQFARSFAEMNFVSNASQMPNLMGAARSLEALLGGGRGGLFTVASSVASVAGIFALATLAIRSESPPRGVSPFWILFGPLAALCTPQTNFYDLGLCIVPLAAVFDPMNGRHWLVYVSVVVIGAVCTEVRETSAVPWFALCGVWLLVLAILATRTQKTSNKHPAAA